MESWVFWSLVSRNPGKKIFLVFSCLECNLGKTEQSTNDHCLWDYFAVQFTIFIYSSICSTGYLTQRIIHLHQNPGHCKSANTKFTVTILYIFAVSSEDEGQVKFSRLLRRGLQTILARLKKYSKTSLFKDVWTLRITGFHLPRPLKWELFSLLAHAGSHLLPLHLAVLCVGLQGGREAEFHYSQSPV